MSSLSVEVRVTLVDTSIGRIAAQVAEATVVALGDQVLFPWVNSFEGVGMLVAQASMHCH